MRLWLRLMDLSLAGLFPPHQSAASTEFVVVVVVVVVDAVLVLLAAPPPPFCHFSPSRCHSPPPPAEGRMGAPHCVQTDTSPPASPASTAAGLHALHLWLRCACVRSATPSVCGSPHRAPAPRQRPWDVSQPTVSAGCSCSGAAPFLRCCAGDVAACAGVARGCHVGCCCCCCDCCGCASRDV